MIKEDTHTRLMQMTGLQKCDMMKKNQILGSLTNIPL